MTYNLNIPAAGNTPAHDQPLMEQNFNQIATSYNTDHIPLNSGSNAGFSNKITLVAQGSDPAKQPSAGIVYSKTTGGHTEAFYEGESVTGLLLQLTNQTLTTSSGQGMMPGGLQIRSGSASANGFGIANAITPAFPTACLSVVVATTNAAQPKNVVKVTAISASSFTLRSFDASTGLPGLGEACFFIATGY